MATNYQTLKLSGFDAEVYELHNGAEFFLMKNGERVYSARVNKNEGMQRAAEKAASLSGEVSTNFEDAFGFDTETIAKMNAHREELSKREKIEKGNLVLISAHIQEVEVTYLSTLNGSRYYQARTWAGRHQYQIRFFEVEGERVGTCNCASLKTCRHLIKAAQIDSEMFNLDFHFEAVSNYKAGQRRVA